MTTPIRRYVRLIVLVAFALGGVLMGVVAARLAASVEQERASALAAEYFTGRTAAFVREMREVTEELQHIRSFFVASRHVSRAEFKRLLRRDSIASSGHRRRRVGAASVRRRPAPARARGARGRPARLRDSCARARRRGADRRCEGRLLPGPLRGAAREEPRRAGTRPVLGARQLRCDGARRRERRAVGLAADRPDPGRRNRQGVPGRDAGRRPDRRGAEPGRRFAERIRPPDGTGARHLPRPVREERTVGGLGHALRVG